MIRYTAGELASASGAALNADAVALKDTVISGVSTDSRTVRPGSVYFAIRGERFDGADFAADAVANGACLALVNEGSYRPQFDGIPVLPVNDTIAALGRAAQDYRSKFGGLVIGVTGSSGKTTAKEMMVSVIGSSKRIHATEGNYNNQIGLPLSVFGLDSTHECAVFEMGMSAAGEIRYLGGIAQPHAGVILNVGPAHLEFFKSVEGIADAKMELLETIQTGGTAIINGDDVLLKPVSKRFSGKIVTFGLGENCDVRAENIKTGDGGCVSFTVGSVAVALKIPGRHNVYNALAALAAGRFAGVADEEMAPALESFSAPGMRMEIIEKQGVKYINDSYNANPLSMKSSLEVLLSMIPANGGRKIAVLGTMLELGDGSDEAHRAIGREFGAAGLAELCFVGDKASSYMNGAVEGGMNSSRIHCFDTSHHAAEFVDGLRREGDIILVKGSRGVRMESVLED